MDPQQQTTNAFISDMLATFEKYAPKPDDIIRIVAAPALLDALQTLNREQAEYGAASYFLTLHFGGIQVERSERPFPDGAYGVLVRRDGTTELITNKETADELTNGGRAATLPTVRLP